MTSVDAETVKASVRETHGRIAPERHTSARAEITRFAWVVNQGLTPLKLTARLLRPRRSHKAVHLRELAANEKRTALEPWHADVLTADPVGV